MFVVDCSLVKKGRGLIHVEILLALPVYRKFITAAPHPLPTPVQVFYNRINAFDMDTKLWNINIIGHQNAYWDMLLKVHISVIDYYIDNICQYKKQKRQKCEIPRK